MNIPSSAKSKRMYSLTIIVLALASAAVMISGCISNSSESTIWKDAPDVDINTDGTVTYVDLEGGFYGIISNDGTKYYPLNLGEDIKKDGLKVRFLADTKDDIMTVQQWGIPVEIISIKEI
ncbi:YgdI/YgdR family lipoprotein [Methanoplanus endosymbiosus]|uniref:YgdI/YgdR family lipoprotein n=1 Tax=Methanoplanus endosymbiosus TaxID=33865 RepID=A0A9E7PKD8_9EURY|nr:YgdI/YgdR family lipoprotein [Methanoplanus endosymbiosus]UUX91450.1 YgdI/YgdR family lipoprotein [Methanoplanus endosymbiosus]